MIERVVCWWSAGVASATAAYITLQETPNALVVYCDTSSTEHPDNLRFLADCERWYGKHITRIRSEDYEDTWDVYRKTGWLVGASGARCATELKKRVRLGFQLPDDIQIFGFTAEETIRARRFELNNPLVDAEFPLITKGLGHADCVAFITKAGIEIPAMYRLGYRNNNCIGCVKGGAGYWNKIRVDFPEVYGKMAKLEREMGVTILRKQVDGNRLRLYLDELEPGTGYYATEPEIECGAACTAALAGEPDLWPEETK